MLIGTLSVSPSYICVRTDNLLPFLDKPGSASFNLSKATKLKDIMFRLNWLRVQWVAAALKTITPEHRDVRQITIHIPEYLAASWCWCQHRANHWRSGVWAVTGP
jgi:hypothetical protein